MTSCQTIFKTTFTTAAALAVLTAGSANARDLVYGSWVSEKHSVMRLALPTLFDGVKKDTNGEVVWKLIAGGQLVDGKGTLPGIKDGLIDAGMAIPSYTPKPLAATNLVFSTLVFGEDVVAATAAATETVLLNCPECIQGFKQNNAVFLGGYDASPFMLMCRDEVKTLADLKGKKVRSSGGGVDLMKMAGATPVAMSPAAATTALQRGALDCVLGAPTWLRSYGYQDVAKHIINYPLGMVGPVLSVFLNRKTWDGMTEAQKMAHIKYLPMVVAQSTIDAYVLEDEKIVKGAASKGVTLHQGGKEFDDLVEKFKAAQDAANIADAKSLGVKDPAGILAAYHKSLAKWMKLSKDIGRDNDKYAAALKREIYDKLDLGKL